MNTYLIIIGFLLKIITPNEEDYRFEMNDIICDNQYYWSVNYTLENINYAEGIIIPHNLQLVLSPYEFSNSNVFLFDINDNMRPIQVETGPDIDFFPDEKEICDDKIGVFKDEIFCSKDGIFIHGIELPINKTLLMLIRTQCLNCTGDKMIIQSKPFYFKFDGKNIKRLNPKKFKSIKLPTIDWTGV